MMLYGLTSSHVGTGDNLSYIDLPIQREKHTEYPKIEASSLKGSIRQAMEQSGVKDAKKMTTRLLGSSDSGDVASAVAISDARMLFFPVKSAKGVFAWVTSPLVLQRFQQDCRLIDFDNLAKKLSEFKFTSEMGACCCQILFCKSKMIQLYLKNLILKLLNIMILKI